VSGPRNLLCRSLRGDLAAAYLRYPLVLRTVIVNYIIIVINVCNVLRPVDDG
jgi:hypothetical protein